MPKSKIKREGSPQQPLLTTSSKPRGAIATLYAAPPAGLNRDDDAARPQPEYTSRPLPSRIHQDAYEQTALANIKSEPIDENKVVAAAPAPAADREGQPQHGKFVGVRHRTGCHGAQAMPPAPWLSSRPVPATNKLLALTKTFQQQNNLKTNFGPHSSQSLVNRHAPRTNTKRIQRIVTMDGFDFGADNGLNGAEEVGYNTFGSYTGGQDQLSQLATVPLQAYQSLHREVHIQKSVVHELYNMNLQLHSRLSQLEARVGHLEHQDALSKTLSASTIDIGAIPVAVTNAQGFPNGHGTDITPAREASNAVQKTSAKRPVAKAFSGEGTTLPGRTKYRKKLELKILEQEPARDPVAGIPTPMFSANLTAPPTALAASFPATPRTPYTPGRIGPSDAYKKSTTSINKRVIHNLNKSMPPANVQLPMVPLTDAEVVIFFFNSLSKPIVSLRLYARGWAPASIVECLNNHREVEPPYLRNTCSVKCTTAIKLGRKLYGADWEQEYRNAFAKAEDAKATDLIRADENEPLDYDIRALGTALKKHPSGDEAGIFTACVKYCIENNAPYTMANVLQLAVDLQDGNVPQHPASPALEESEGDFTGDEESDPPSPLAERSSFLGRTGGSINFTPVNDQHEARKT